jgi:HK97 family phage major capsid protein
MKKLKELRESFAAKQKELRDLQLLAETEKRDWSEAEETKANDLLAEIEGLRSKIATAEKLEANEKEIAERQARAGNTAPNGGVPKEIRKYNFLKALRSAASGRLEGLELEMHQEGINELRAAKVDYEDNGLIIPMVVLRNRGAEGAERRDMTATGGNPVGVEGGYTVAQEVGDFVEYLRQAIVLPGLGARFLTGLSGNIGFPVGNADAAAVWETETSELDESNPTMSQIILKPNRLGTFVDVSQQLLLQSSEDVQNMVVRMLLSAVARQWQIAAINGDGTGKPLGILQTVGIGSVVGGTNGAAPNWARTVELETKVAVENADFGTLAYLTNTKVRGYWKTAAIEAGSAERIWDRQSPATPVNNYNVGITNAVPGNLTKGSASAICSAIIFGNFDHLVMGQWGGMQVLPNPYTKAKNGLVEMIINSYVDARVLQPKSFAAMVDALTT